MSSPSSDWPLPKRVALYRYALPLRTPLPGMLGGNVREGFIFEVILQDGRTLRGEAAPLPGFSKESMADVQSQLSSIGHKIAAGAMSMTELERGLALGPVAPSVRFALESILYYYRAAYGHAGPNVSRTVTISALCDVSAASDDMISTLAAAGYETVKVKVGGGEPVSEATRVVELMAVADGMRFRLDANRRWSLEDALLFADTLRTGVREKALSLDQVEYFEEPLLDPEMLESFAHESGFRIALDESLLQFRDWTTSVDASCIGAVVLKPTLLGLSVAYKIAGTASRLGVPSVVSSTFESGIGMSALVAMASDVGVEGVAAGLGTYAWLREDVLDTPLGLLESTARSFGWMNRLGEGVDDHSRDNETGDHGSVDGALNRDVLTVVLDEPIDV